LVASGGSEADDGDRLRPETTMTARHRANHSKPAVALVLVTTNCAACGGPSVPRPERTQVVVDDYVAVPYAPRPPPPEVVPAPPRKDAVWEDGTWDWSSDRYRWTPGAWVLPPTGAKRASWVVVRREDGQLFFAPSSWKDATGATLPEPAPLVRARSRASDE
jgi:hypothetical protein